MYDIFHTYNDSLENTMQNKQCKACNALFKPCPQVVNQTYCSKRECQRVRKRMWQKAKRQTDPSYRENQYAAHRAWLNRNPEYVSTNRKSLREPNNVAHFETLQSKTCFSTSCEGCEKMDSLIEQSAISSGTYCLKSLNDQTKKMDAWIVKITVISKCCHNLKI